LGLVHFATELTDRDPRTYVGQDTSRTFSPTLASLCLAERMEQRHDLHASCRSCSTGVWHS